MRAIMLVGSGFLLMATAGCGASGVMKVAKLGMQVAKGAEADVVAIKDITPESLEPYKAIRAGTVGTDVEKICPLTVLADVRTALVEQLQDKDITEAFPGGGKTLAGDVSCRFFKQKGMIGKEGRLDWLVTLVDAETKDQVGVLFIEGLSESPLQHGVSDMAKENTKELCKFLTKRLKDKDKDKD